MRAIPTFLILAAALPLSANVQAAERFQLERTDNGFVRMDTQTGQMSFCEERSGQLKCTASTDDGAASAGRIEALERRVDELESRVAELGGGHNAMPSDQEFEQTMSLMERFMRRFMGIVKEFETEVGQEQEAAPDRT